MSYVLVGYNFYACDTVEDIDYEWPEDSIIFVKGTESYNGNYYKLVGGGLVFKYSQESIPFAPDVLPSNRITVSTTSPSNPNTNDIWIDVS